MADLKESRVPDIGDYHDIPVIELLVKVGDTVAKDEGLVTLESDKATMEVPAEFAGVIKELRVKLGDNVSQGAVVAVIEAQGAGEPPRAEPVAAPLVANSEVVGTVQPVEVSATPDMLTQESIASNETAAPRPPQTAHASGAGLPPVRFDADAVMPDKVPYASPVVRLYARELGVDLLQVKGSGDKGRITREDVQQFVKSALAGGGATRPAATGGGGGLDLLPWPKVDFSKFGEIEAKPLSRIQKISGANLARNWAMIPHVTQFDRADISSLEELRVALNNENAKAIAAGKAGKVTMLAFMIKACVAALKKYPTFNASLDGDNLVLKKYFNIGFAADTPNGLVVPVLRDADRKGVMQIAQEMGDLAALARDGKLKPDQMQGGCFTISSLGGIGGTAFTPIINAPEVAILGVSKSDMQPVWDGKAFQPRMMVPLSLSYDHRVIDGALAARFTSYLAQVLADMRRAML
ncbi:dihydrolipoyllysine-residue acetyltransferase [Solilutibacter silvestris]|uniref:Acetyltransferase component of pyruvate dehydrogenase complex n=1 Tax=Solilutibacter silvestris TaxID=1645665 RepID=A0A2K1Q1T4_9GAMM|nr:dihydrolipoyllysine-residue acetyltransferase [Lysobacter silvestris]PNS08993.1 dihydrolipoyllysine-residue acetyltransferase [Lysobacter silvestris]